MNDQVPRRNGARRSGAPDEEKLATVHQLRPAAGDEHSATVHQLRPARGDPDGSPPNGRGSPPDPDDDDAWCELQYHHRQLEAEVDRLEGMGRYDEAEQVQAARRDMARRLRRMWGPPS